MIPSRSLRIGGVALAGGAGAYALHIVARSVLTAGVDLSAAVGGALWAPVSALGILGSALVLLGLPTLYAVTARSAASIGLTGTALLTLSWMLLGVFVSLYGALVAPWLARAAPPLLAPSSPVPVAFVIAIATALLAELVGTTLLAISIRRGRSLPGWVAYALPVAALLTLVGDLAAPQGPARDLAVNLLTNLGPLLLVLALGAVGARLAALPPPST